jgi:hypothetical protein
MIQKKISLLLIIFLTAGIPLTAKEKAVSLKKFRSNFTGFYSADGKTWKSFTTFSMELSNKIFLGLAVTSHNSKAAATTLFSNISFINE